MKLLMTLLTLTASTAFADVHADTVSAWARKQLNGQQEVQLTGTPAIPLGSCKLIIKDTANGIYLAIAEGDSVENAGTYVNTSTNNMAGLKIQVKSSGKITRTFEIDLKKSGKPQSVTERVNSPDDLLFGDTRTCVFPYNRR